MLCSLKQLILNLFFIAIFPAINYPLGTFFGDVFEGSEPTCRDTETVSRAQKKNTITARGASLGGGPGKNIL